MRIIGTEQGLSLREKTSAIKTKLGFMLRHPNYAYRLNSREVGETGLAYSDEAIDIGELAFAFSRCTLRQQQALQLWLGPMRATQDRIAREIGVSVITVKRDIAAALRDMAARVWDEPAR